jgi:hypothetical protein
MADAPNWLRSYSSTIAFRQITVLAFMQEEPGSLIYFSDLAIGLAGP